VVDGVLRVRVAAAPVDGAANRSLLRLLAAELGVPARAFELVGGASGRRKLIEVEGVDEASLRSRWRDLDV
jgi:uncharacterized protein YggU (UPF0235/DUF167 family)